MKEKKEIHINGRVLQYEEKEIILGVKQLNKSKSAENLRILGEELNKRNVRYGLMFGTLLGAVRENDFIDHDEDTDVFVLEEDRDIVMQSLFSLEEKGLKVIRYLPILISLMRDNEYIDLYFFHKTRDLYYRKVRKFGIHHVLPAKFLEEVSLYGFCGGKYPIPIEKEKVLETLYGKDWKVPVKNFHAPNNTLRARLRLIIPKKILNIRKSILKLFNK
ncbi:LicD family protein [Carboxylicivirga marina]|uniref:LicD family protein n=1 Tax=Carboxylicivirga marina TaxID=2800988 RepID=UPI0025987657|nr:LicD family protein [uncultured Carboxylicivirga sp.]